MPALLLIHNRGPRRGEVVSIFDANQDPGAAIRANTSGKWAFVYVTDSAANGNQDLLAAKIETLTAEERAQTWRRPEVLGRRALIVDLDALTLATPQALTEYSPYSGPGSARAVKVAAASIPKRSRS